MARMADRETWARRVAEWRSSGLSSPAFCAGKPFTPGGLRFWAHRLKKEKVARRRPAGPIALRVGRVVRVRATSSVTAPSRPTDETAGAIVGVPGRPVAAADATLVVELGAARVTVRGGVDRATLATVLELLAPSQVGGVR
jgi:hypothetical protein